MRVEPTLISVLHWGRLLDGELFATSRYVEWAVLSTITDSAVVRRILDPLNLPSQPRTAAPARDRAWRPMAFGFDAA